MKKLILFIVAILCFLSCVPKTERSVTVTPADTTKIVDVIFDNEVVPDTTFEVSIETSDSLIIAMAKAIEDSMYREFKIDSTEFRRTTLLINGGYNGWDDRYRRWLQAREALNLYTP